METIDSRELAELRNKARCWDDLLHARSVAKSDPDSSAWKQAAREQGLMAGIRACRAAHGLGLMEARDCVEAYLHDERR